MFKFTFQLQNWGGGRLIHELDLSSSIYGMFAMDAVVKNILERTLMFEMEKNTMKILLIEAG
jgi:hypothetical protein